MIKAVVFDFDGVLVDTLPATASIYRIILKKYGKQSYTDEEFRDIFDSDWREVLKSLGLGSPEQIADSERIYMKEIAKLDHPIFPQVKETLAELKKNYKIAIASNNGEENIKKRLKELQILDYFDEIVDCSYGIKPDPGQLIEVMKRLDVKPEETVFVGDMEGDVKTARNANIKKFVAVTYGFHTKERLKGADVYIDDFSEILSVM